MTLESIDQNAKSILEMYANLRELEKRRDQNSTEKISQLKDYIIKLALNIRRLVEEEKQNVS